TSAMARVSTTLQVTAIGAPPGRSQQLHARDYSLVFLRYSVWYSFWVPAAFRVPTRLGRGNRFEHSGDFEAGCSVSASDCANASPRIVSPPRSFCWTRRA